MTTITPPTARPLDRALLLACLGLLAARALASVVLTLYDDAFITFRYAENLAAGHGLVYHLGEPVLGTSSPLFAALLGGLAAVGLAPPDAALALGLLADTFTLALLWRALPSARPALPLLLACSPMLARVGVGGMEAPVFAALGLAALTLAADHRHGRALALAALAVFLRPEAGLLGLALLIDGARVHGRKVLPLALPGAALLGLGLGALTLGYGQPVPQSVLTKAGAAHGDFAALLEVLRVFLFADPLLALALPFALWRARELTRPGAPRFERLLLAWAAAHLLAYLLARPAVWSWYALPTQLGVLTLAATPLTRLAARLTHARPPLARLAPALPLATIALWLAVLLARGPSPVTARVYRPAEAWARAHLGPGDRVLASDIGLIGWAATHNGARVLDAAGLVGPEALGQPGLRALIDAYAPSHLYLNADISTIEILDDPKYRGRYRLVARFSPTGAEGLADLAPAGTWVQDYLLWEHTR